MSIFNDEPEEEKLPEQPTISAEHMNYTIVLLARDRVIHHILMQRSPESNMAKPDSQFPHLSGWKDIGFSES